MKSTKKDKDIQYGDSDLLEKDEFDPKYGKVRISLMVDLQVVEAFKEEAERTGGKYQALMRARNQSFGTIFTRAMSLAETTKIEGIPSDETAMTDMLTKVMTAITTGNSAELKRTIAPLMGEAEAFITQIALRVPNPVFSRANLKDNVCSAFQMPG